MVSPRPETTDSLATVAPTSRPEMPHAYLDGIEFQYYEDGDALAADYAVLTVLRGPDGQNWDQQQESLSGGSDGTTAWDVGRWLFH